MLHHWNYRVGGGQRGCAPKHAGRWVPGLLLLSVALFGFRAL